MADKSEEEDNVFFGEMQFEDGKITPLQEETSKTIRKFVKIPKDIESKELLERISSEWKWGPAPEGASKEEKKEWEQPNLLISVTGGAWDFPVKSHVKEVFRRGIVEAAVSAKAWIVTGGTHGGVMKYVGKAVSDYELAMDKEITTIGIATWGTLKQIQQEAMRKCQGDIPAEAVKDDGIFVKRVTEI